MSVWNLNIWVKVSDTDLKNATRKIKEEFDNTGKNVEQKLNKSIMWWLQAFAGTQIASGLNKVAGWALTLAGNLEQADVAFTTMLGSADSAKKMLKELSDFASRTPFELTGIRDTAKQLLAYGIEADKILPTLKSLGDVSAWLSVPIQQIAYAYGQVRSAGRLLGQDLRQFTNAWVPIIAELAKNLGVAESGIKDMVSAGKIWFADVEKAFQTMSWEWWKFANLMDKQSGTLLGAWSNLKDATNSLGEVLGWLFTQTLTNITKVVSNVIDKVKDRVQANPALAKGIGTLAFTLTWLIAILWTISWIIGLLAPLFIALTGPIWLVIAWVSLLAWGMAFLSAQNGKVIDKTKERTKELKNLQKEQEKLDRDLKKWKITQEEYEKQTQQNKEEQEKYSWAIAGTTKESYNYRTAIEELAKKKLKLNSEEWKKERDEIRKNTEELIKNLRARLEIEKKDAQEVIDRLKDAQEKDSKTTQIWAGSIASNSMIDFNRRSQTQAQISWIEAEISQAQSVIDNFDKEYTDAVKRINESSKNLIWSTWSGWWLSEWAKQLLQDQANLIKDSFDIIEDEFKKSTDNVKKYREEIGKIWDEFEEIANKAKDELRNINQSLSSLDTDYANTQWARYAQVNDRLTKLRQQSDLSQSDYEEINRLENEKNFLLGVTTEEVRKQAVEYALLSEAQKNAKKYEEERLALLEKQAILTAVSQQTTTQDEDWNTVLNQKVRINDLNQYEYEAEAGKWIAITDAKNIEYARDIINQQTKMQQELVLLQQKIDQEVVLQEELNERKIKLEEDFTKFVNEQTAIQRNAVKWLIDDINKAIDAINKMNALKSKSNSSSGAGFMAGGYTWEWPLDEEVGAVHAREYVLSNDMLTKLPGIVPALENLRMGGNFDYSKKVELNGVTVNNQVDLELLLDRIRFKHL